MDVMRQLFRNLFGHSGPIETGLLQFIQLLYLLSIHKLNFEELTLPLNLNYL